MTAHHRVAVVGGGQAGLSLSHYLKLRGIDHRVFEKERAIRDVKGEGDTKTKKKGKKADKPDVMEGT